MKTRTHLGLVHPLINEFPRWLDYFVERGPFTRREQLDCHVRAIALRRGHESAATASEDPEFVRALYETLQAWGLGARGSRLRPMMEFSPVVRSVGTILEPLESLRIDAVELDVDKCIESLWKAIESTRVTHNNALLVAGTKTLHHLLPDLVPPMDRAYTQTFFGWNNPQFQYNQEECFRVAYAALVLVARRADVARYVGTHRWHSSVSKVVDNGLVGLVRAIEDRAV